MKMRKYTGCFIVCLCLMFRILLPVQAIDNVTLRVEKTQTANELQLIVEGVPDTKSISLNLKVEGNVTFINDVTPSKALTEKGGRVDTRQDDKSKNTLDIYITSKQAIDKNGSIVIGTVKIEGKTGAEYTIKLNDKKDGIKGVSSSYAASTVSATDTSLKYEGNKQTIIDPNAGPIDPEGPGEPEGPEEPEGPTDPEGPVNPEDPTNPEEPEVPTDPDTAIKTIVDGEFQLTGKKQIKDSMKLKVKEVSDKEYLALVQESLAKVSTKYKAFNIDVTNDGKSIILEETVRVRMPIPSGFDASKLKVYDIQKNIVSDLSFSVEGNYVSFDIIHLGNFVIAEQNLTGGTAIPPVGVNTGDKTSRNLYLGIASASLVCVAILMVLREKRKLQVK